MGDVRRFCTSQCIALSLFISKVHRVCFDLFLRTSLSESWDTMKCRKSQVYGLCCAPQHLILEFYIIYDVLALPFSYTRGLFHEVGTELILLIHKTDV